MKQARQGDVYLRRVEEVPAGAKPVERDGGRVVLAYGEVTGHAHAIADEHVELLETADGARLLVAETEAFLRHEEHDTVTIPPGIYEVRRQREYTPEAIRTVAD